MRYYWPFSYANLKGKPLFSLISFRVKRYFTNLGTQMRFLIPLRIYIEMYFVLLIISYFSFVSLDFNHHPFLSSFVIILSIMTTLTPLLIVGFLMKFRKRLLDKKFEEQFGEIYTDLDTKNSCFILFVPFFYFRRLMYVTFVVLFESDPEVQWA